MNRQAQLLQRAAGQDALGQPVEAWTVIDTLWVEPRFPSGVEQLRGDANASLVRASFKVRRRQGITAGMRLGYAGEVFDIQAILPDEIERQWMFLVSEKVS